MHQYVEYIVYFIVALQLFFFIKNLLRMHKFSSIFKKDETWRLHKDYTTDLVDGIEGQGNSIFDSIVKSINKYLGNNAGSVIDFNLLKDSIDRHCDSAEEDISTQTPIPLYLGLAGTMAGVILGLWDLLETDAIMSLIGSSSKELSDAAQAAAQESELADKSIKVAAEGIDALLSGVAWAMGASICGILLTTLNSLLFKSCKLKHEEGKNSFLAWMQSELLPMLPSDTSQALTNLVKNLNEFNNTFSQNTSNLGNALEAVNQSYAIQAEIIKAVHDMDVMKMAKANVRVLQELQQCTDRLEQFNEYLYAIQGYTSAIHEFETLFNREADRIHVLEEIRDYFRRHKGVIAQTMSDADDAFKTAIKTISESTTESVGEFHTQFVEQSEQFKQIIQQERDAFQQYAKELAAQFGSQLDKMPKLAKQLEEIADIPVRLDKLIEKIEKSNARLADQVAAAVKQSLSSRQQVAHTAEGGNAVVAPAACLPDWMKYTGITALIIIALACVFNVVVMFYPIDLKPKQPAQQPMPTVVVPPAPLSQPSDTTAVDTSAAKPATKPAAQTAPAAQPVNQTPSK